MAFIGEHYHEEIWRYQSVNKIENYIFIPPYTPEILLHVSLGNDSLRVAWWHQAITRTNVDLSSVRFCGIHRRALSWGDLKIPISKQDWKLHLYTPLYPPPPPCNEIVGGTILVTLQPSVRLSVRPSRIPCPLCSAYSSGWIHFIFIHHIKQLQKVCCA